MMDRYSKILETLKKQLQLNQELLIFSREKLEILRANDTVGLVAISNEEEKLLRKIIDLEKERGNDLNLLKAQGQDITNIRQLIAEVDPRMAEEMEEVSQNLKRVLSELQLQNDVNKRIMDFTLEQIEISKNFILSDETPANYGKKKGNYSKETLATDNKFFEDKV